MDEVVFWAVRLSNMDRVRFGRALGVGAREAGKALMKAADAATAPNPNPEVIRPATSRPVAARVAQQVQSVKATSAGVKRGGKRFGEAVWGPFAKASSVLWLEVTGVLFGMFAAVAGVWVWTHRADLAGSGTAAHQEWLRIAMLGLFGYLTVSSYVKAARRSRR